MGNLRPMTAPDLTTAASVIDLAHGVVDAGIRHIAATGGPDVNQVVAYDIAHAASAVETGRAMLVYGTKGELEAKIACAYIADAVGELIPKLFGREADWNIAPGVLDGTREFLATFRAPEFLASLADTPGPRHLESDFEMVQDTFRRFANEKIAPVAEHIHRENLDIPEDLIQGLAELGGFGLSVPVEYDGYSEGGESEYMGMVVATEDDRIEMLVLAHSYSVRRFSLEGAQGWGPFREAHWVFTADGQHLVIRTKESLRFWCCSTGRAVLEVPSPPMYYGVSACLSTNGGTLLVSSSESVERWETRERVASPELVIAIREARAKCYREINRIRDSEGIQAACERCKTIGGLDGVAEGYVPHLHRLLYAVRQCWADHPPVYPHGRKPDCIF